MTGSRDIPSSPTEKRAPIVPDAQIINLTVE
jgi:hypothetical protein